MELNNELLNDIFNRCSSFIDEITNKYRYPDNISHLLYLIVPAFIIKYGFNNERKILNTFNTIPIIINDVHDDITQAFYSSTPFKMENVIKTKKVIVLNNYEQIPLMQLLDNLVHEYNHAVNSMIDEISFNEKELTLRTGVCHIVYDINTLEPIKKEDDYILEEIINTKQTEEIIDIINLFNNFSIENTAISTTLYSIKHSISNKYISDAYGLESFLCKELMNNKTFIFTLGNLRLNGNVNDMNYWFDNITGISGSYKKLIKILIDTSNLQEKYEQAKFFKKAKLNKIRSLYNEAMEIINVFNANCNYK